MTGVLVAVLSGGDRLARADDGTAGDTAYGAVVRTGTEPDGEVVLSPPPRPRDVRDLDGLQVWIGPTGGAARVAGTWDSAWGGGLQVLRVREASTLAAVGVWVGGVHYAARDGGRIWIDGVAGTRRLGGRMLGISLGPAVELGSSRHPRFGAAATAWWFTGITPYARAGVLTDTGGFLELGVALALPAWRY